MAVGSINRLLHLFLIAANLNNILIDKTVLHGRKAFFSTIVDGLQADGLISTNFRNICYLPGDRVVIRKYSIETTDNDAGLLAMANLTTLRSTNGTGKQILCEETLEFLGKTQNIHGQEFDDLSKNETHICIIFNTVGRTQKQTCCFFHITWKPKTTVFLLLKLKRQRKPVAYYSNTSATQRLVLSGDIEENPGPIQDRKTSETPAVQRTKIKAKCPNCTKTVQSNHKRFLCTVCFDLYHAKCTNQGNELRYIRADKPQDWVTE